MYARSALLALALVACRGGTEDTSPVDADADGFVDADDCNDHDAAVSPDAAEVCDGIDNDCDGAIDEEDSSGTYTWYADADSDGFGDASTTAPGCEAPAGHVDNDSDCDDGDPAYHPGAPESDCTDPNDYNCDGSTGYADADDDGFPACEDCADDDAAISPDATEVCNDLDDDCDGDVDDFPTDASTWFADGDGDGYGGGITVEACEQPDGFVETSGDCRDGDATTYPGAEELCDGTDNDCDGDVPGDELDADDDGFASCEGDCDDGDSTARPGGVELCDGIDNDCDGTPDDSPVDQETWYTDADGDGFGDSSTKTTGCGRPDDAVDTGGDCDDSAAAIRPTAPERCDDTDWNCDGDAEDGAIDALKWYADDDGDGYGDATRWTWACSEPSSHSADATDCDDTEGDAFPGSTAIETPGDGVDTDCDGNDFCTDMDCDGLPDVVWTSYYSGSSHDTTTMTAWSTKPGWGAGPTMKTSNSHQNFGTADFDGDGYVDIPFPFHYDGDYNTQSRIYYGPDYTTYDALPSNGPVGGCIGDFDNDERPDIVFAGYYNGNHNVDSYVYYNGSGGFSASDRDALPTHGAYTCVTADLDDDGYLDLVFPNYYNGSSRNIDSYVYFGSSSGFSTSKRLGLPTNGAEDAKIGDLDNDGYLDIVFTGYYNNSGYCTDSWVYWGAESGFSTSRRTALPACGIEHVQLADLNKDSYLDVVLSSHHDGDYPTTSYIYWGGSSGFSTSNRTGMYTNGGGGVAVGDVNGDGWPDVALSGYHNGSTNYTDSYVYYGPSFTSSTPLRGYGVRWGIDVADLDKDGYADIALAGYHYNGWGNQTYSRIYWGSAAGANPSIYSQYAVMGAHGGQIVPSVNRGSGPVDGW